MYLPISYIDARISSTKGYKNTNHYIACGFYFARAMYRDNGDFATSYALGQAYIEIHDAIG